MSNVSTTLPAENNLIAKFATNLINPNEQAEKLSEQTSYEVFELTLSGDNFTETFYCAFDNVSKKLIVKLAENNNDKKKYQKSVKKAGRVASQLATALTAYAEHFEASSVHVAIPKGHREYAAWMRSCMYVGLKLSSSSKAKKLYRDYNNVVMLSLKISGGIAKDSASSAGSASTCEGWSPSHSDSLSDFESGKSEYFLDLSA